MNDTTLMSIIQCRADLIKVDPDLIKSKRALFHEISQRASTDIGHYEIGSAFDYSEVIDLEDVWMIEGSNRLCFFVESGQ